MVTATRAEYGILRGLLREMSLDSRLTVQLIVTGTHLETAFGSTESEIDVDGFGDVHVVHLGIQGDSPVETAEWMARGLVRLTAKLEEMTARPRTPNG